MAQKRGGAERMIDQDPMFWKRATWILAGGMAIMGGLVNWVGRVRRGKTQPTNIIELVGEVLTSGFVGVGVFMALNAYDQPVGLCAAGAGIGGHMATRLLYFIEEAIKQKIEHLKGCRHDH